MIFHPPSSMIFFIMMGILRHHIPHANYDYWNRYILESCFLQCSTASSWHSLLL